jgi:hypothetical protein
MRLQRLGLLRVDIRFATFIASNDHAIGTPGCALLPLWQAANETEEVGAARLVLDSARPRTA